MALLDQIDFEDLQDFIYNDWHATPLTPFIGREFSLSTCIKNYLALVDLDQSLVSDIQPILFSLGIVKVSTEDNGGYIINRMSIKPEP